MNFLTDELDYEECDKEINKNDINYFRNIWLAYDNFWYKNKYDKSKYKYVKTAKRSPNTQYGKVNDFFVDVI